MATMAPALSVAWPCWPVSSSGTGPAIAEGAEGHAHLDPLVGSMLPKTGEAPFFKKNKNKRGAFLLLRSGKQPALDHPLLKNRKLQVLTSYFS